MTDRARDMGLPILELGLMLYTAWYSNTAILGFEAAFRGSVPVTACEAPAWSGVPEPHQQCPALGLGPPSAARDAQFLQLTQQLLEYGQCAASSHAGAPSSGSSSRARQLLGAAKIALHTSRHNLDLSMLVSLCGLLDSPLVQCPSSMPGCSGHC
jgi:hypothetical protein